MKFPLSAVVACIAATVVAGPAFALDFPSRKPGLWEIQTQTGEAAGGKGAAAGTGGAHTMQQCIDAST
ncbi:hypothetical protein DSI38_13305, partial [Mycobacterium tuberculosis]